MTVFRAVTVFAALLAVPASAQAGTLTRTGNTLSYTATAGGDTVEVATDNLGPTVYSSQGMAGAQCNALDVNRVSCPGATAIQLTFVGGTGENRLDGSPVTDGMTITAIGSTGSDLFTGTKNADMLDGGAGADVLSDGDGNDVVIGGPDNDTWTAGTGTDSFNPGSGTDIVSYASRVGNVAISLAGGADDGEAGEGDDAGSEAEVAEGGNGNDILRANHLGNTLTGNAGNDALIGGAAEDRLVGSEGDDSIDARDGRFDSVDCGPGSDVVFADPADFTENCEVAPDADGDGYLIDVDCAPANPAIHPGAGEIIGNAVDEDCKDGPLYARVVSPVAYSIKRQASRHRMRFTKLTVGEIKAGDRIELRCSTKARGCPFTRKTVTGKNRRTVSVITHFKSRYLRRGAVIEIRTTRPNEIGSVRRLTVGRRGTVKSETLCLKVGATAPTRCA